MKIIMAGGGTGGHINPLISIANYMKEKHENTEILFIGTEKGLEKDLVPKAGFNIKYIKATGLTRKISLKNIKTVWDLLIGSKEAKKIIKEFNPDIIIGTGGYVSFSTLREGYKMKIPTLIHESNSLPGIANKILARKVDKIAVSFKTTYKEFNNSKKVVYTGNPLSKEILKYANKRDFDKLYDKEKYKVLVTGGSQGAKKINEAVKDLIIQNKGNLKYKLIFSTGKKNYDNIVKDLINAGINTEKLVNIEIKPYIFEIAKEMNETHLMIGRCGAMTISEITAMGIPSILVPLPQADRNYQELNARELEQKQTAKVILDNELNGKDLNLTINDMLKDKQKLKQMAINSYQLGMRDAIKNIEDLILELTKK